MTSLHTSPVARLSPSEFAGAVLSLQPSVAVFDCDGTLWNGDAGYDFMLWSIEKGIVSRNAADWIDSRYRLYRSGEVSESAMCGEMVQIYDGLSEGEIRKAAAAFFHAQMAGTIFPEMQALIAELEIRGAAIWAVSSTNNWVIEEGLRGFHIPPARILAARVEVVGGTISSKLLDVPTGPGKAVSLARAGIENPDAAFGNSIHDAAMLEIAHHPFPVNPTPALLHLAARNGWPVFYPESVFPERL